MATYVTLINFTDQGIRNVKDTANRASAYKKLATQLGCTLKETTGHKGNMTSSRSSMRLTTPPRPRWR